MSRIGFTVFMAGLLLPVVGYSQSSIRGVDFANYVYPIEGGQRIRLVNGKSTRSAGRSLAHVSYGDVTGDGNEDAIVRLGITTGGSAMPNELFVFAFEHMRTRLLWAFTTGDRADGGYRNAYASEGVLVVELYGRGAKIEGNYMKLEGERESGACCPKHYTRTRYRWLKGKFQRADNPEIFVNSEGHGSPMDFRTSRQ